jgi:hypothetical protein
LDCWDIIDDQDILSTVTITTITRNPCKLEEVCGVRLPTKRTGRVPGDGPSVNTRGGLDPRKYLSGRLLSTPSDQEVMCLIYLTLGFYKKLDPGQNDVKRM